MTITDQVKGAAAAVKDKVAGATGTSAQGDKEAHKATEAAHDRAAKGNISNAQDHAKDAAKQTLGAADAKKDEAKTGKTGVQGVERDANKAASATQKEGAKGSMAATKDNVSAAAGQAKEKMSAKGEKNKAEAQTSAYNTRSKAANKIDPHT